MNVLKSVTSNKSEPDLIEASSKQEPTSHKSSFSFFGMRSKSKENVIDTVDEASREEAVKKLPTLDDKTIDKNKKFAPMENLTDAGKPKKGGLARLKRIRDEMFKKKHQTLKEEEVKETEEAKEMNEIESGAGATGDEAKKDDKEENENGDKLDCDEQKAKKDDKDKETETQQSSTESSTTTTESSTETSESEDKNDRKVSNASSKYDQDGPSSSKVERKPSNRSVHYEEDRYKSTPVRGSTFQRSESMIEDTSAAAMRSISPNQQQRVRVSGQ